MSPAFVPILCRFVNWVLTLPLDSIVFRVETKRFHPRVKFPLIDPDSNYQIDCFHVAQFRSHWLTPWPHEVAEIAILVDDWILYPNAIKSQGCVLHTLNHSPTHTGISG